MRVVTNKAGGTRSWYSESGPLCEAVRGQRQARWQQTGSLVYCDGCAAGAVLFLIKTQRLSVGLLQGLSDVLPVNATPSDSILFLYAGYSSSATIPPCFPSTVAVIKV